jgi:nicotinamide-nucleotide amidase
LKIELLITGNEILEGSCTDTNTSYIAREIHLLGLSVQRVSVVRDSLSALRSIMQEITQRADVCIMTGGLGPTTDDLTLDALAQVADVELVYQEDVWQEIYKKLAHRKEITESQRRQARVPTGGMALHNQVGIAPGMHIQINDCTFFAYPGVPSECKWHVQDSLIPWLKDKGKQGFIQRTLRFCWLTESELQEKIKQLNLPSCINIGYQAMGKEHRVKLSASTDTLIQKAVDLIQTAMAEHYLNDQDIPLKEVVFQHCRDLGFSLALAESCTGGAVSAALTSIAGSSEVVIGGVVAYSNQVKQEQLSVSDSVLREHGAVSEACAQAMATGVRQALRSDWGISITGIAGPGGGSVAKPVGTVCFAWANEQGVESQRMRFKGDRNRVQNTACIYALFGLYKRLMKIEH